MKQEGIVLGPQPRDKAEQLIEEFSKYCNSYVNLNKAVNLHIEGMLQLCSDLIYLSNDGTQTSAMAAQRYWMEVQENVDKLKTEFHSMLEHFSK